MRQPTRKNITRYNVPLLVPVMLYLLTSCERDPCAASAVTYVGFISSVLLPRFRTAANSGTLANGLAKIRAAREFYGASTYAHTPEWEKSSCKHQWHLTPWRPMSMCDRLIVTAKLLILPTTRCRRLPQPFLCDTIQKRDFALPTAQRTAKVLGPISRHHVAQILPMIRKAARATRPGLAVGILRLLCNGMCATKRLHVVNDDQTCSVGCNDEPDCLSHCNKCPLLFDISATIWRNAGIHTRRDLLLHDLITQTLLETSNKGLW